jgi:hypothetical protein
LRVLVGLIAGLAMIATMVGGAGAQTAASLLLSASDLGPGWTSRGATNRTVSQGDVYRDIFAAPPDYPSGTGVALQVVVAVSSDVRDSLASQVIASYTAQGYEMVGEDAVGDPGGTVGTLKRSDATSTMYVYNVGNSIVLVVAGASQPDAPGIDTLALSLAKAQAAKLS